MSDKISRSSSFSSVGSGASSVQSAATVGGAGGADGGTNDLLEQNQNFQAAVFGVLYTLAKEKYDTSKRFAVARLVLDFIQCFILIVNPAYGWNIDEGSWVWKAIEWVHFSNPIITKGYSFYITILYILAAALAVSIILCIWVGWCFKNDRFPYIWPIKMLRLVVAIFFTVFYIGSLAIFMVAVNCRWFDPNPVIKYHLKAYPAVDCLAMPHLVHMAVALCCSVVFCMIAFAMTIADFEMNPASQRWLAAPHTRVEVRGFFVKTIMTVTVSVLGGLSKIQALILCCTSLFLFWSYVRWEPHFNEWINHCRAALYCTVGWTGIILVVLVFSPDNHVESFQSTLTLVMIAGLAPAAVLGFFASYGRLRWRMHHAVKAFMNIPPDVTRLKDIYRFPDAQECEIVSRVCRRWTEDDILDPDAVKLAETVMKVGLASYHDDVFLTICYSNFLIEVQNNYQSGSTQLQAAKKLEPSISDRFAIFVREQEHKQKAQSQSSGESAVDLVSYVEFQRNYRLLLRAHKQALYATRHFWKQLLHHDVSFQALARAFRNIEVSKTKADRTYKMVLDRYPSSVKLLRSYGRFLEDVKNDPWTAAKYYSEADKTEEQQENAANDAMLSDAVGDEGSASMLAQVDEKNNAVVVINASGTMQMANKVVMKMFGYKKGELEGKNVSILMPQPFNQRHNGYLRNYVTTGKAKVMDTVREVVAIHKERYVFPLKLAVTKVSGTGADSLFMGLLKPTDEDPNTVKAWMMTQGTLLCVDQRFPDWFGKGPNECVGKPFSTLATEQDVLIKMLDLANASTEQDFLSGRVYLDQVHFIHKYAEPVPVSLKVTLGGTDSQRIFVLVIKKLNNDANNMMVTDHKGRLMYMSGDLGAMLGYTPKQATKMDLSKFMSHPYSMLHHKYMKEPSVKVPLQSCRNAATVVMLDSKAQPVPVKPHLSIREDNDQVLHIVNIERSTWERGVDERRLGLVIDADGIIREVSETPMALFGIKPASMVGNSVAKYVDVLAAMGAELPETITQMLARNADKPGYSWRVGVHPPVDENAMKTASAVAQAILAKNTKPALMQIEIKEPANEGDEPIVKLYLWKADMVTGVALVDKDNIVIKPNCCALHPTGLLFGVANQFMMKRHIGQFLPVPKNVHSEWLLSDHKVKGAMKTGTTGRKIGPLRTMDAFHMDGQPLSIKVIAVAKENKQVNIKVNFNTVVTGNVEVFRATLAGEVERVRTDAQIVTRAASNNLDDPKKAKKSVSVRAPVAAASGKGGVKFAGMEEKSDAKGVGRGSPTLPDSPTRGKGKDGDKDEGDSDKDSSGGSSSESEEEAKDATLGALDGPGGWGAAHDMEDDQASGVSGSQADGQSIMSASEAGGGYQTDFKRGRRFKKLMKLLSSTKAKADLTRYTRHTYGILIFLLTVHTVCFALFMVFLNDQDVYVKEVDAAQDCSVFGLTTAINARAVANIYAGLANEDWYTENDLTTILSEMTINTDLMEQKHQGLYLGFDKLRHLDAQYELADIWEGKTLNETQYIDTRTPYLAYDKNSLWLMGNAIISASREIVSNHKRMAEETGNDLTLNRDWEYVNLNMPRDINNGYRYSLNGLVLRAWDAVGKVNELGIALLVVEGCIVCFACAAYSWILLQQVARQRYGLYSVFLVIPTGFLRALASKHVQIDGEDDNDSDSEAGDDHVQQQQQQATSAVTVIKTAAQGAQENAVGAKTKAVVVDMADAGQANLPLWRRIGRALNPARYFSHNNDRSLQGKRKLIKDNKDTLTLTLPFVLWGILVICVYTFSYISLKTVSTPLVNLDVANRVKAKVSRVIFTAHELVSVNTTVQKEYWKEQLLIREADLHMFYDALLYGSDNLPEMAFSKTSGTLFAGAQPSQMFFRAKDECYVDRLPDRWCYTSGHVFYEVSNNAIDPMVRRLLEEAKLLGNDANEDITFNSTRFDYMWRVAFHQLWYGLEKANNIYSAQALAKFANVKTAHIVLFVISWLLALCFILFMFRPFTRRANIEARQVAELLSQLPPEMDVEGLVASAMMAGRSRGEDGDEFAEKGRRSMDASRRKSVDASAKGDGPVKGENDDASSVASSM